MSEDQAGLVREVLARVVAGEDLSADDVERAIGAIMSGNVPDALIAGFVVALRTKGETVDEVTGAARSLRAHVTRVDAGPLPVLDTAGTGGDGAHTFNISTLAAIIAAAAGARVAKHGNRAVSSRAGSADVLDALGVNVSASKEVVERSIRDVGIGFLFAPQLHPALGHAARVRRELGMRTMFNLLGPLANPASADRQIVGVFDERWVEPMARVLANLGTAHAWVVHGKDGLDELSLSGPTTVAEAKGTTVRTFEITPEDAGLERQPLEALAGGDAAENAALARRVLAGERGAPRDAVCLNAGAALVVTGRASSLTEGVGAAARAIDDGSAERVLARLAEASHAK